MRTLHFLLTIVMLVVLNCKSFTTALALPPGSKCVNLKSALYNEYLYSAVDAYNKGYNSNQAFTWRRKKDGPAKDWGRTQGAEFKYQGVWVLEKKKSACTNCFVIKSGFHLDNPEPLYSVSELDPTFVDKDRRPVYTYSGKNSFPASLGEDIWEVEAVPGYIDRIRIKSYTSRNLLEYLYAASNEFAYDQDRRTIYTWSSTKDSDINTWKGAGDWIMTDVDCPPFTV